MKHLILILFCLITTVVNAQFADRSVLAEGTIYALEINETGVYKLTYNFLGNNGIDPASVNPLSVKLYAQGGGMLPQSNATNRVDDFQEIPLQIVGGTDGSFDPGDYLLFYAEGANAYHYDASSGMLKHELNIYDDVNYYYLKLDAVGDGLRIEEQGSVAGSATTVTTFDDFRFVEPELTNILESGRKWFGREYRFTLEEEFSLDMQGIVPNSDMTVEVAVFTQSTANSSFTVEMNNDVIGEVSSGATPISDYQPQGIESAASLVVNSTGKNTDAGLNLKLTYNPANSDSKAYLDYVLINAARKLKWYGTQTVFRSIESQINQVSDFQLSDMSTAQEIWDISDPLNYKKQVINLNGTVGSFQQATLGELKEFIVFDADDVFIPSAIEAISNQDLHGLAVPNLVIISPTAFLSEAQRLAEFRRQSDGLTVEVVELSQIYQEFSSGRKDLTAMRDFVRMLYLKSTDDAHTLRYVLLFGDASYDYKDRITNNGNHIPVYESINSIAPVRTYSSDDYIGFLESNEGDWAESGSTVNSHTLEIGIGRLPINTLEEARLQVDKLIHYSSTSTFGDWRKRLSFVADDGDFNTHQNDANRLANMIDDGFKSYDADRVFVDAFPQVSIGITKRSEVARAKVFEAGQEGVLILNFTGHGAESGWTSENVLDHDLVREWTNLDNMPLLVTATCQFGRYDDPTIESGAEVSMKSENGGAIALLTTTRPVFSFSNFLVNQAFYQSVFEEENGEAPRLGDVIRKTKNRSIQDVNNRNFALLGDPSMRLAYPKDELVVTEISRESGEVTNTLRALDRVTVKGEVRQDGSIDPNFNGLLEAIVFEKPASITTLGDEGINTKMTFQNLQSKLYEGSVTIESGKFEFSFVVPVDIDYQLGQGKVSLYAQHETDGRDASGYQDIQVGGSNDLAAVDITAPEISLYLDNEQFVSGNFVSRRPLVLADISDISGLNLTGIGLGHDLIVSIDEEEAFTYTANDAFTYDLGSSSTGKLQFQIPDQLAAGAHRLTLTVFDAYNNGISKEVEFRVTEKVELMEVLNFPNPFNNSTTFSFTHNREGDELAVSIEIYSTLGQLMAVVDENIVNSPAVINQITWDGIGDAGTKLSSGLYIYRITIRSKLDGEVGTAAGRLHINK